MAVSVLLVDNDTDFLSIMSRLLTVRGYIVATAPSGSEALGVLKDRDFDLVVCDQQMEGMSGLEVLKQVQAMRPGITTLMVSAFSTVETVVHALQVGAFDFVTKPFKINEFLVIVERALKWNQESGIGGVPMESVNYRLGWLIAESPAMKQTCILVERLGPTDVPIMIRGERGTGRALIARTIHAVSPRNARPLIEISCSGRSEDELAAELFGILPVDPSPDDPTREPVYRLNCGGTVFLKDVDALPLSLQDRLLQALKDKSFTGTDGASRPLSVRFVTSSDAAIEALVDQKKFRKELQGRIATLTIPLKPLKDRRADILPMAVHFLAEQTRPLNRRMRLGSDTARALMLYAWPGNAAELRAVIQATVEKVAGDTVMAEHLPHSIVESVTHSSASEALDDTTSPRGQLAREFLRSKEADLSVLFQKPTPAGKK